MKAKAAAFIVLLLLAPYAGAQTPRNSPQLQEAERLNAEVVRLYGAGRSEEALPLAARVLELREKELGPTDQLVAVSLTNLASVELRLERREEAKGHLRRAVAVLEKGGEDSLPSLISAVEGLALLADHMRDMKGLYKRVLALKEKAYGAESPKLLPTLYQLGRIADSPSSYDERARYFTRYVEIAEKTNALGTGDIVVAYERLGCVLQKSGKSEEADAARVRVREAIASGTIVEKAGEMNDGAISKPQPKYPLEAKGKAQGTIEVEVLVGETGTVLSACAREKGDRSLKEASEVAAYGARFAPVSVNGTPVMVKGVITYRFVLR